ncbi:unnamed protein product, partial [Ilex paraguariensis]
EKEKARLAQFEGKSKNMNPPKLDAPLFETTEAKELKDIDPGLQDLQTNVF